MGTTNVNFVERPNWTIGNSWKYHMDFDFIVRDGSSVTFSVNAVIEDMYAVLTSIENSGEEPNYVLTLDEAITNGNDKSENFIDIAEPMWEYEKTPHEIYIEERFANDILDVLDSFSRGFITRQLLYDGLSVKEVAEKNNMSEDLVRLTHKLNVLRLRTFFKEDVISNEGDEKFDLDEFNDTYDKEFFNGE